MKLKQLFVCLIVVFLSFGSFTNPANAISESSHDYGVQSQFVANNGTIVASHLPLADIQDKPGAVFFITKETWENFLSPGPGKYKWIEVGGIKGQGIATIGTHRGYFYGWQTCPNDCIFWGAKYGSGNKDGDQDAVYEIRRHSDKWRVYVNNTLAATTPYDNYEAGTSSDIGIENAALSSADAVNTFTSGAVMYGWQGRRVDDTIQMINVSYNNDTRNYRTPVYPNNMRSTFSTASPAGNITTFLHD